MTIVLYGTETGNAEMVAEDVAEAFGASQVINLSDFQPDPTYQRNHYLIVCSTYGDGELPASAKGFAAAQERGYGLDGVPFAVFGLGDQSYETFAGGAKTLSALMLSCGAVELAPLVLHDANSADLPEDAAIAWAEATPAQTAAA